MDRAKIFVISWRIMWVLVGTILTCIMIPLQYILYYNNAFEKDKPLWRDTE